MKSVLTLALLALAVPSFANPSALQPIQQPQGTPPAALPYAYPMPNPVPQYLPVIQNGMQIPAAVPGVLPPAPRWYVAPGSPNLQQLLRDAQQGNAPQFYGHTTGR